MFKTNRQPERDIGKIDDSDFPLSIKKLEKISQNICSDLKEVRYADRKGCSIDERTCWNGVRTGQ